MANEEHLNRLKQGVGVWNKWREEHPDIQPDLSGANLRNTVFLNIDEAANLRGANLRDANLQDCNLGKADFSEADLSKASFNSSIAISTNFSSTILRGTDLANAKLFYCNLHKADLRGASFDQTNFTGVILIDANFSFAQTYLTVFGDIDLQDVQGLETVKHQGPSIIGIDTIYRSEGNIPEVFLRRAGVPDSFIDYMHSLVSKPVDFYSCFISFSSKDQAFAYRIYADLQSNGIRCWLAPEGMDIGDKIRPRVDETIRRYDKLLVVLSKHSIKSNWVAYEVEKALDKEPEGFTNVLFPIRLDKAVLSCDTQWAKDIQRRRHIGNFERWKEYHEYQLSFNLLLRGLTAKQKVQELEGQ